jgi:HlyD family secretion protein
MKKAEIAVAEAQSAYNQIAWKNDAGTSSEAATLQSATIELESARAAYAESSAAADNSDLQSTVSSIKSAQVTLDELLASPTAAEVAAAKAQVTDAQATLDDLRDGPDATGVRSSEIALEQTLIDLEEAYATLQAATVVAPIDGTVMAVAVAAGDKVSSGATVVTLADPSQLELTISVAELDIPRVTLGQQAQVEIDALAGQTFDGEVAQIAPANDESASSVSYPVTIRLTAATIDSVRPGMSAVGALVDASVADASSWLVPTNSIRTRDGAAVVRVVRNGATLPIAVTTGAVQGEWTVVQSPDLQAGDQVVGSVTSFVNEATNQRGFGAGMGGPPSGGMPMGAP